MLDTMQDIQILDTPPAPGTPEWEAAITASKIPAMIRTHEGEYANLGYLTAWETFEQLQGRYTPTHTDFMLARFARAHAEERPAAEWWISQQDNPADWMLSDGEVAFHNPAYPQLDFATVDFVATHLPTGDRTRLEVKNPDLPGLQPGWFFQSVAQEAASALKGGIIVSPIHGDREWHPTRVTEDDIKLVMGHVAHFRGRLDMDMPPAGGDKVAQADLLARLEAAKLAEKQAKRDLAEVKAEVEATLGINKRLVHDGKVLAYRSEGKFAVGRIPKDQANLIKEDADIYSTVTSLDIDKLKAKYPDLYAAAIGPDSITVK